MSARSGSASAEIMPSTTGLWRQMMENEAMSEEAGTGADLALIAETNSRGADLRCGEYVSQWDEGEHPYGQPDPCAFCGEEQNFTELW
jgi:hypothetical protein